MHFFCILCHRFDFLSCLLIGTEATGMTLSCAIPFITLFLFVFFSFFPRSGKDSRGSRCVVCEGWLHVLDYRKGACAFAFYDDCDEEYEEVVPEDCLRKRIHPTNALHSVQKPNLRKNRQITQPQSTKNRRVY